MFLEEPLSSLIMVVSLFPRSWTSVVARLECSRFFSKLKNKLSLIRDIRYEVRKNVLLVGVSIGHRQSRQFPHRPTFLLDLIPPPNTPQHTNSTSIRYRHYPQSVNNQSTQ